MQIAGTDHRTICKFASQDSQRYRPVWKAVLELSEKALAQQEENSPDPPDYQGHVLTPAATAVHTCRAGTLGYHYESPNVYREHFFHSHRNNRYDVLFAGHTECKFSEPYSEPPRVLIGLSWLDFGCEDLLRAHASVYDTTPKSFKPILEFWEATICWGIGASWLEIAPGDSDMQTGRCSTVGLERDTRTPNHTNMIRHVRFYHLYEEIPEVVCWFVHLDSSHLANHRMEVFPENITRAGFDMHFQTWGDSSIWELGSEWMAFSKGRPDIFPIPHTTFKGATVKEILFRDHTFQRPPSCFVALTKIDSLAGKNLRVSLKVMDVTEHSMRVQLHTWLDSHNFDAGFAGVAII